MIGNDRKYPDAVYSAVGKHELGDTLTRRQIEAVLDAAGLLIVAAELERLADALPMGRGEWNADYQAGRYDARQFFLNRAAELRGAR